MVLQRVTRGPQPDVLPIRVRQQQQLLSTDQPRVLSQSRPPHVFPLRWTIHRHGNDRSTAGLTAGLNFGNFRYCDVTLVHVCHFYAQRVHANAIFSHSMLTCYALFLILVSQFML